MSNAHIPSDQTRVDMNKLVVLGGPGGLGGVHGTPTRPHHKDRNTPFSSSSDLAAQKLGTNNVRQTSYHHPEVGAKKDSIIGAPSSPSQGSPPPPPPTHEHLSHNPPVSLHRHQCQIRLTVICLKMITRALYFCCTPRGLRCMYLSDWIPPPPVYQHHYVPSRGVVRGQGVLGIGPSHKGFGSGVGIATRRWP